MTSCETCFIIQILTLADKWDFHNELYWHISPSEKGSFAVHFEINCNDLFYWGCADAMDVTSDDLETLERALKDASEAIEHGEVWGASLWCARKRQLRPQGAAYSLLDKELWPLFDECGPERETGIGNPFRPGEYKADQFCTSPRGVQERSDDAP